LRLKKQRKINRLKILLAQAGVAYDQRAQPSTGFEIFRFDAPIKTKEFGPEFWGMSKQQLEVVCDEVMHWDGSVSGKKTGARFSSTVKASADFVQYAYAGCGYTARVHTYLRVTGETEYSVQVRDNGEPLQLQSSTLGKRSATMSVEPSPDGFKYCFMVPSTFLVFRRNGCIFASGNTGKTKTSLWAADFLIRTKRIRKVLVVAPLSTLQATWAREAFKTTPGLRVSVLYGTKEQRLKALNKDVDVYVINHDGVATVFEALRKRKDIDLIILDELATYRNGGAIRTKMMGKLCTPEKFVWGLTGGPMPNDPTDVWAQCRLVTPWSVPSTMRAWRDKTMTHVGQFTWVPKPNATADAFAAMVPSVRYTLEDVMELPELIEREIIITQSDQQVQVYKELCRRLVADIGNHQVEAINEAAKINKLLQISCGAVYTSKGVVHLDCENRLAALTEIISEAQHKVIVFANFKHTVEVIRERFEKEKIAFAKVTGDTPPKDRGQIFNDFQNNPFGARVLLAHPRCMAHGLTLTAADTIVWFGPTDDLEIFDQANARFRRVGQKRKQQVLMLCGTKAEQVSYKRLRTKQKMQGALLEMFEVNTKAS
jgi:superfamily II DNA or RNA helicase